MSAQPHDHAEQRNQQKAEAHDAARESCANACIVVFQVEGRPIAPPQFRLCVLGRERRQTADREPVSDCSQQPFD
jgi:hypothetical protein